MKKKIYTSPRIYCIQLDSEESLLLDTSPNQSRNQPQWQPNGKNSPTIDIKEEEGGNLGNPDSEISGAKGSSFSWDSWD